MRSKKTYLINSFSANDQACEDRDIRKHQLKFTEKEAKFRLANMAISKKKFLKVKIY